jgi:hypothetical protein
MVANHLAVRSTPASLAGYCPGLPGAGDALVPGEEGKGGGGPVDSIDAECERDIAIGDKYDALRKETERARRILPTFGVRIAHYPGDQ